MGLKSKAQIGIAHAGKGELSAADGSQQLLLFSRQIKASIPRRAFRTFASPALKPKNARALFLAKVTVTLLQNVGAEVKMQTE